MILPTLVPTPIDEQRAINRIAAWVAMVHHKLDMDRDEVRAKLESLLRERLRSGRTDRKKVIDAAKAGCRLSHEILMAEFHDMLDVHMLPPANLCAYAADADQVKFKRGKPWYDDFVRNIGFCTLIPLIAREFALNPTRNREQRRARQPSACSALKAALARNKINIEEATLNNLWSGLYGQLVRESGFIEGLFSVPNINFFMSCMTPPKP
jgi:hypothetical protein